MRLFLDSQVLTPYNNSMVRKGRPTKPRLSDLGQYIEKQRKELNWSVLELAHRANVSYKTLSKLELARTFPRHPGILIKVANALGVHPDQLLLVAHMTPFLRPSVITGTLTPQRRPIIFLVNEDEHHQIDNYLQFLRYMAELKSVCTVSEIDTKSSI